MVRYRFCSVYLLDCDLWKALDFRRETLILATWYCADLNMQMNPTGVARTDLG
jgi:hypothetical protein